jgi:hypothetical protein
MLQRPHIFSPVVYTFGLSRCVGFAVKLSAWV